MDAMETLPELIHSGIEGTDISNLVVIIMTIVFAVYAIITMVLTYHWKKYSITKKESRRMRSVYTFISIFLWIIIVASAMQAITRI